MKPLTAGRNSCFQRSTSPFQLRNRLGTGTRSDYVLGGFPSFVNDDERLA